ncbi:11296_t:CDS:10 [Ambispora leptoticha]|uniref:3-dehydrosphinganine reductase n=1 Tax=Ambispora leptoticha TaxID=144679 RepID=A0A9N9G1Y2_9GLOM|nr:11296_t:CDS:10 [Ambispora leptoticha]
MSSEDSTKEIRHRGGTSPESIDVSSSTSGFTRRRRIRKSRVQRLFSSIKWVVLAWFITFWFDVYDGITEVLGREESYSRTLFHLSLLSLSITFGIFCHLQFIRPIFLGEPPPNYGALEQDATLRKYIPIAAFTMLFGFVGLCVSLWEIWHFWSPLIVVSLIWRGRNTGKREHFSTSSWFPLTKRSELNSEIYSDNATIFQSDISLLSEQCDYIYDHEDRCAFVREHCESFTSGLLNYLDFYFCGLNTLKFPILVILFSWLLFLFGFVGVAASDFFCPNLSTIAAKLHLSESMAGVTFLAFGNGSPDLFSTFSAVTNNSGSLALGELIGAASFISSIVAGSMAVITPFRVTRVPFIRDVLFFTGAIAIVFFIIMDGVIHLWESALLVIYYFIYVSVVVVGAWWMKNKKKKNWLEQKAREEYTNSLEVRQTDYLGKHIDEEYDDDQDAYGYNTYSETDLLLPEVEHDVTYDGTTSPISMTSLAHHADNPESNEYFTPSSYISMNDVVDQSLGFHHPSARSAGRPLHRGLRPSLFGAIEFRDVVKSLKLDSNARALGAFGRSYTFDFYNRGPGTTNLTRSRTLPTPRNDIRRRRSWVNFGVSVPIGQLTDANSERPVPRRHHSTSDLHNSAQTSSTLSPVNDDNQHLRVPSESDRRRPPRLLLIPPTPQEGRSPSLSPSRVNSPLLLTSSPVSMSPNQYPFPGSRSPSEISLEESPPLSPTSASELPGPPPPSPAPSLSSPTQSFTYPSIKSSSRLSNIWDNIQPIIFPSLEGFSKKSAFAKLIALLACPAILLLALTLPVVDADEIKLQEEEKKQETNESEIPTIIIEGQDLPIEDTPEEEPKDQRWNRCLTSTQFLLAPIFAVTVLTLGNDTAGKYILYSFFVGIISSILCYSCTKDDEPPPFYTFLCFFGFAIGMVWIFLVANEVVALLQALGLIMGLSDAILGLTIFAMGNSLGDFVANITIAKMGFPMMAMSACFGGPMLRIGISGSYMTLKTQKPYTITVSPTLFISSLGLSTTLISSLFYLPRNDYRMTREWGYYLISLTPYSYLAGNLHPLASVVVAFSLLTIGFIVTNAVMVKLFGKDKFKPAGKHAYITGGSTGLGKALAVLLAKKGASVTIVARDRIKLDTALEEINAARINENQIFNAISADMTIHAEAVRALDEAATKHDGKVPDFIFCCAGAAIPGTFIDQSITEFETGMKLNYFGTLYTVHEAARRMAQQAVKGKIVMVSSVMGFIGFFGYSQYAPTKHAIRGLADCLRNELILYDISVHCYFPGTIRSPGLENENKTKPLITKQIEGVDEGSTPEQCAEALYKGLRKGQYFITSDIIANILRAGTRGVAPSNNIVVDGLLCFVSWIVAGPARILGDKTVRDAKSTHILSNENNSLTNPSDPQAAKKSD